MNNSKKKYEKLIFLGDFTASINDNVISYLCSLNYLTRLIDQSTCYRSSNKPICINLQVDLISSIPSFFLKLFWEKLFGPSDFYIKIISMFPEVSCDASYFTVTNFLREVAETKKQKQHGFGGLELSRKKAKTLKGMQMLAKFWWRFLQSNFTSFDFLFLLVRLTYSQSHH